MTLPLDTAPLAPSQTAAFLIERLRAHLEAGPLEPVYIRLSRAIEQEIAGGWLSPSETLPGERVLAEGLALSRVTVRKAIDGLVATGRLVRRPGAGTVVASRVEKSLTRLTGFSEEIAARGLAPGCVWLLKERAACDQTEARALDLALGSLVLRLQRIRTAGGAPIAWERAAVPVAVLSDPNAVDSSLYAALAAVDAAPVRAVQRLRAEGAGKLDVRHLRCLPGAPLLVMERRCFDRSGRIVESTQTRYLGEAYDFITEIVR